MLNTEKIKTFLEDIMKETQFLVEVKYNSKQEKYYIFIDSFEGIKISECENIHKALNKYLIENDDDSAIEVSSPGLTSNLLVWQQYKKNIGQKIQIQTNEDQIIEGEICNANEKELEIEITETQTQKITYNTIKKSKVNYKF